MDSDDGRDVVEFLTGLLVGALIGGFLFGQFVTGTYAFVGSVVVAFLGACLLIWVVRQFAPGRSYA